MDHKMEKKTYVYIVLIGTIVKSKISNNQPLEIPLADCSSNRDDRSES